MQVEKFDNKILIIKDNMKDSLLRIINDSGKLLNIKLITLSELKKKYFFDYDKETIYYVCKKYNVISDIAKIYLENLYYIGDIDDDKVIFLKELNNNLLNNNLLIVNKLFKQYINNSNVVLFELDNVDKFYNRIFNNIKNVQRYELESLNYKNDLVICNNRNEEIAYVASSIAKLIKSGISINNIKIANVSSEYNYIIKSIFNMFKIPVNLNSEESIKGTKLVKIFKSNYDLGIEEALNKVKESINNSNDNDIYKQLINIINSYSFISESESKEYIFNDIDHCKIKCNKLKNAVNIVNIEDEIISDNDYVFMINYVEGVIPFNNKDEDYLSDKVKRLLGISMSFELNKNSLNNLIKCIKRIKNLVVTFPNFDGNKELYMSSSYKDELFIKKECNIDFENSNLYNKLKLVSLMDDNKKYGTINNDLIVLNNHYKDFNYISYNNKYSGIDKINLYNYLGNKLTLSYTSFNEYNGCAFKYYLDYILRINKFEDTFEITVGNIFHKVLSECFTFNYNFEEGWNKAINNSKYVFNNCDKFFLDKLKCYLQLIIKTIKEQLKYTQLDNFMYEKEVRIVINDKLNVTFKGFIDKLMYKEVNGQNIVVIVDYKTGNPNLTLNNSLYGLDMQLPIYMYLIKNSNIVSNVRIGGLYLQKILTNSKSEDDKINDLKLQGYSNSDEEVLEYVDSSYKSSNVIKSLRIKNDGTFYSYSKVISDDNIDYLCDLVSEKINDVSNKILDAKFDINPKVIGNENKGCTYCKYNDICYKKNEDIVNLKEITNIFGGESNE